MKKAGALVVASLASLVACGGSAQAPSGGMVVSSDPGLVRAGEALIGDLARRSGLPLRAPVRLERRSREHLVRYLESKLDEELPVDEARATVDAYALLGLVPADLDLRAVLMALYTEQIAGFYEPDSTTLFVLDDQPDAMLQGLLVHELVHAIQDQNVDLDALTDRALGNDRAIAAQAAIEGHATLVMLEYMTEEMAGASVDFGALPEFAEQMRPAIEAMRTQFPALAGAPRVIQESLLFPYLEGAGFVQSLWRGRERTAPFGEWLPLSTDQVLTGDFEDDPVELALTVSGARVVREDVLGRLETSVLLDEHGGADARAIAGGWAGDRYVLVDPASGGGRALVWYVLWETQADRERFAAAMAPWLGAQGGSADLEQVDIADSPATVLRVGALEGVTVSVTRAEGT